MHHTCIKTPVIALAVLCAVSTLTLGIPKTVKADDHLQSGETVREVSILYREYHHFEFVSPSETTLSAADYNVPKTHAERRPWSAGHASVELQVPKALVRTLLTEAQDGRTVDLQVPKALLTILYAEGCVQGP